MTWHVPNTIKQMHPSLKKDERQYSMRVWTCRDDCTVPLGVSPKRGLGTNYALCHHNWHLFCYSCCVNLHTIPISILASVVHSRLFFFKKFARSFVCKLKCWHILYWILLLGRRWLCTARATGASGFSEKSAGEARCLRGGSSTLPDLCPSFPLATYNSLSLSQFPSKHHEQALPISLQCRPGGWFTFLYNFLLIKGMLDEMTSHSHIFEWN